MKALRLFAPHDLRLVDEPIPEIGPGEVLIRVKSVGLCASDLHWYSQGRIGTTVMTKPLILGHESAGEIAAIGEEVLNVKVGDRVAVEPAHHCGGCEYCRMGEFNVCPTVRFFGTPPTDGALREFMAWPADLVIPLPDSVSFNDAAMVEPLAVGLYAVEIADIEGGERIGILGAGAIGLSVLQAARLASVGDIYVSEPVPERRELAKKMGATEAFSPEHIESAIAKITDHGLDIVFECAGDEDAVRQSAELACPLGKVMIVGIPDKDQYAFPASAARRKQLTAVFVRRSKGTTEYAIELTAAGRIDVASFATHRFSIERAVEAFELAASKADGVIRSIIDLTAD